MLFKKPLNFKLISRVPIKKIALFCNSLDGGGAEAVMTSLSNLFFEKGITVDFLVASAQGVHLDQVKKHANFFNLDSKTRYVVPKLYKYLRKHKPDVILSTQTHINIATILASRLAKTKVVVREATTPSIAFKTQNEKIGTLVRVAYNNANKVISVSNGVKKDLVENYSVKEQLVKTIYNPIISIDLHDKAKENIDHPWYKLGVPIIVSMGRIVKAKDFHTLIKAFNIIKTNLDSKLIIIGDYTKDKILKSKLDALINSLGLVDAVDFIGYKSNPFPYIKNASLYILSSIYEGLPGALIQAVALGCNVVSTDCESGPKEILQNGVYGKLVPVKDYIAIAKESLLVLKSKNKLDFIDEHFNKKYSAQGICEMYLDLFESIVV